MYVRDIGRYVLVANEFDLVDSLFEMVLKGGRERFGEVFVVNENDEFVGLLSVGDVLRAAKYKSESKYIKDVMNPDPITVGEGLTESEVWSQVQVRMRARYGPGKLWASIVPVLDGARKLKGLWLHTSEEVRFSRDTMVHGLGFVGLTLSGVLSGRGYTVVGVDPNKDKLSQVLDGDLPILEPYLPSLIEAGLSSGLLRLSDSIDSQPASFHIITVGTPVIDGLGVDLDILLECVRGVRDVLRCGDHVMLRSTVPVGTCRARVIPVLEESGLLAGRDFCVSFCPERTVEGKAVEELETLPQIVGGYSKECTSRAQEYWSGVCHNVVLAPSLEAAELIKLVNNSFRDHIFAFSNALVELADCYNLDSKLLIDLANDGYPRDKIPMPSPGVGGYCLTKDPLIYANGSPLSHAKLAVTARRINIHAGTYPYRAFLRYVEESGLSDNSFRILVVGIAFKGNPATNDLRGSQGVRLAQDLMKRFDTSVFDFEIDRATIEREGLKVGIWPSKEPEYNAIFFMNNNVKHMSDSSIHHLLSLRSAFVFDAWSQFANVNLPKNANLTYHTLGKKKLSEGF